MRIPGQQVPLGTPLNTSNPLSMGLVACWLLNEGGGKKAFDSTGRCPVPGAYNGTTIVSQQSLKGQCVSFAGSANYISCGNQTPLNPSQYFTISWWFKRAANALCHAGKYTGLGTQKQYLLQIFSDNNIYFVIPDSGGVDLYTTTAVPSATNGNWNLITAVYNGTQSTNATKAKIYLNGRDTSATSPTGAIPTSVNSNTTAFEINRYNGSSSAQYGTCLMNQVMFWNRPLTPQDIWQLYINSYQMFSQSNHLKIAA